MFNEKRLSEREIKEELRKHGLKTTGSRTTLNKRYQDLQDDRVAPYEIAGFIVILLTVLYFTRSYWWS